MRNKLKISLFAIALISIFSISLIITAHMQNISSINDGNSSNDSDEKVSPENIDQASTIIEEQESTIIEEQESPVFREQEESIGGCGEEFLFSGGILPVAQSDFECLDYYPIGAYLPNPSANWYDAVGDGQFYSYTLLSWIWQPSIENREIHYFDTELEKHDGQEVGDIRINFRHAWSGGSSSGASSSEARIYNYNISQWEVLGSLAIYGFYDYSFDSSDLSDPILEHYIDDNGYIKTEIYHYKHDSVVWYWFIPVRIPCAIYSVTDYAAAEVLYKSSYPITIESPERVPSPTDPTKDLLISYDTALGLDVETLKYSLDGQKTIPISGETYITMPEEGEHTIQLFGCDGDGQKYKSELRTFKVSGLSLLCVHGFKDSAALFNPYFTTTLDRNSNEISDFIDYYGDGNVLAVDHYRNGAGDYIDPEFEGASSLEEKALGLYNYIINKHASGDLNDYIDISAHSMGGLIVRYMVKHYYHNLIAQGIVIKHVATAGTPNHGTWSANLAYIAKWVFGLASAAIAVILEVSFEEVEQSLQMSTLSPFLLDLNSGDETPYDISYNTYRGNIGIDYAWGLTIGLITPFIYAYLWTWPMYGLMLVGMGGSIEFDSVVTTGSTPLSGADHNRPYYGVDHGGVVSNPVVLQDILDDMKA